jgi:hypothetical protein
MPPGSLAYVGQPESGMDCACAQETNTKRNNPRRSQRKEQESFVYFMRAEISRKGSAGNKVGTTGLRGERMGGLRRDAGVFKEAARFLYSGSRKDTGARKRTRTSTPLREPGPEPGASANSAIRAQVVYCEAISLCPPPFALSTRGRKQLQCAGKWPERGCEPGTPAISFSYQHH